MYLTSEQLVPLNDLYDRALYLQAYRVGSQYAPIKAWDGPEGRVLASRLARQLGAPRLALWHQLKAWRSWSDDPEVRYYHAWTTLERQGPYRAWIALKQWGDLHSTDSELRASWYAFHAQVAAMLRDFDEAERWLDRAVDAAADSPWVHTSRGIVLQYEDRREQALEATDHALRLQPWYRPAVQQRAHLLTIMNRDQDAFDFLAEASDKIECPSLHWQLSIIYFEREDYGAVARSLEKYEQQSPLLERSIREGFHWLRSFLAYRQGDDESAIQWAEKAKDAHCRKVVERLSDPARQQHRRVVLPVGFVAQDYLTCGPATLTSISRFWSRPADHVQLADEICYNGTSSYAERHWAEQNGYFVREFTVTEEATQRLIDAGFPFTVTTTEPNSAHLQAVVGYDGRRGTVIMRDPSYRNVKEAFSDDFLENYRPFGPRGMVLVPIEHADRLRNLELPDSELWEAVYSIDTALIHHRRDDAAAIVQQIPAGAQSHIVALHARRRLAMYDANPSEDLMAIEKWIDQYPDNAALQLVRLGLLRNLSRRTDRVDTLRGLCAKPNVHPSIQLQYAQELSADARSHDAAIELLQHVLRSMPNDPAAYTILAGIYWDQQRLNEALELYRFAACLDDRNEQLAESYFLAAQHCRRTDEALHWFHRRFKRLATKSSHPARTYDWALRRLERVPESLAVLDEALRLRPEDGELRLQAAMTFAAVSHEHSARAEELLREAQGQSSRPLWLRTAARLAMIDGKPADALALYREALSLQPLAVDLYHWVARLIAEQEGPQATLTFLRSALDQFPHHQELLRLYVNWLRDESPQEVEPAIRQLLEMNPTDVWALGELALLFIDQQRYGDADAALAEAIRLNPNDVRSVAFRGHWHATQGQPAEAKSHYRRALQLSVDMDWVIHQLLACSHNPEDQRAELEFVRHELTRQVVFGDGLLAYRVAAKAVLEPNQLLALLREALAARPDLWHAWSACVQQLVDMEQLEQAHDLAKQATDRFPLMPRLWIEMAQVAKLKGDDEQELKALETAHRVNPTGSESTRSLAEYYLRHGDFSRASSLMETAVSREPLDPLNHGWLADVLWRKGDRQRALAAIERALQLAPAYEWGWGMLDTWSHETGEVDRLEQVARRVNSKHSGEAQSWLNLAKSLRKPEHLDERFAAVEKAIGLRPVFLDAHSYRIRLLVQEKRFEEALAACRPPQWSRDFPVDLLTYEAWVHWQQGHEDEAIRLLRGVLQTHPRHFAGWTQLADWLRLRQQWKDEYLQAAQRIAALQPYSDTALGYLGEAQQRADLRVLAKETYRRAFHINPANEFVGLTLFDLHFEDQNWTVAEHVLKVIHAHAPSPYSQSRRVALLAQQGLVETSLAEFQSLCLAPGEADWPYNNAYEALVNAKLLQKTVPLLDQLVADPNVNPHVGTLWSKAQVVGGDLLAGDQIRHWSNRPVLFERAVWSWVETLISTGQPDRLLGFVVRNKSWLLNEATSWTSICFAFVATRQYQQGLTWAERWHQYSDAKPWMLVNVAEILRACARPREAHEVSNHALTIAEDHGTSLHRVWLAVDAVIDQKYATAKLMLSNVPERVSDADFQFLAAIVRAILTLVDTPAAERAQVMNQVQQTFNDAVAQFENFRYLPSRQRVYRRLLLRLMRLSPTLVGRLWVAWKYVNSFYISGAPQ